MTMKSDDKELLELLKKQDANTDDLVDEDTDDDEEDEEEDEEDTKSKKKKHPAGKLIQWSNHGSTFVPTGTTVKFLPPGAYEIQKSSQAGIYFEKIPVKTENLLRFPDTNSDRVIEEIKTFWSRKDIFKKHGFPFKRGIILWGPAGCHAAGTKVIMHDGSKKNVEDVVVGDLLMGPDSRPREVLQLRRGQEEMFEVVPRKGPSFTVNEHHILHLKRSHKREVNYPETLDIELGKYLGLSKWWKSLYKLERTGVEFPESKSTLPLPPYFVGVWLGDGTERESSITAADPEIIDYIHSFATSRGLDINIARKPDNLAAAYTITGRSEVFNTVRDDLNKLNLRNNKHIPDIYLRASRQDRLQLLAGLIDTDGYYSVAPDSGPNHKGYYEIIQVREDLARQIVWLASSLGFGATIRKCIKGIKAIDFIGEYWRVGIYGKIHEIPVLIERKRAKEGTPNKNPLVTGIKEIISQGVGEYYGFTLSDDHLYLTNDFMIHHNSGKSCTLQFIMKNVIEDLKGIVIIFDAPTLFIQGMRALRQIQKDVPVVAIMEDLDSILEYYSESSVLNILDGINQVESCIFLATTNYPEKLGARVINRPSRFDKRFKIGFPSAEARLIYFQHLFAKLPDHGENLNRWVKDSEGFSMAHMKELFVAVKILGDDYEEAVEILQSMQEQISSERDGDGNLGFGKD